MYSPETTRKSSWFDSPWYMPFGWPGRENLDAEAELGPLLPPFEVGVLPALLAARSTSRRAR